MPSLPNQLPEKGKTKALQRWLNQLRAVVRSQQPLQSLNVWTEQTASGTYRKAKPGGGGSGGDPVWLP